MNPKYRIIILDGDKSDRALLGLALRNAIPGVEVVDATSTVDVAHLVSIGSLDGIVSDSIMRVEDLAKFAADVRRRYPACLWFLFGSEARLPALDACIGEGIDGRFVKTSAGYLELPGALFDRLRSVRDLVSRIPGDPGSMFSSVFPGANCLIADDGSLLAVSREFELLVGHPRFNLLGRRMDHCWSEADELQQWTLRLARATDSWVFVGKIRTPRGDARRVSASLKLLEPGAVPNRIWAASFAVIPAATAGPGESREQDAARVNFEQLAFSLSHDMQAPLNSLGSHARWLRAALGTGGDADIEGTVVEIAELTARMQAMLDSVVQFSVLKPDDASREMVNLDAVVTEALGNLKSLIDESGATIERQAMPVLAINRNQMVQVFQNLLSNALKFCDTRVPRVEISAVERDGVWQIRFQDNGIGIEAQDTERIFEMFKRLHSESEFPGIGAGLAICKRIVEAHGGRITVNSRPGRGSCFIVEIPANDGRVDAAATPTTRVIG